MKNVFLAVVLLVSVSLAGCDPYKQAMVFARDAAQTNQSFEREVKKAHATLGADGKPFVSDADELMLLEASRKIAQYDDAAVTAMVAQKSAKGALANIDQAIATADDVVTNGLAAIKDSTEREAIHAILLSLRGGLISAKAMATK